jgi:hypothetical protein
VLQSKFFVVGVFNASFNFTSFVIQTPLFVLFDHLVLLGCFEMRLVVQLWQQVSWSDHIGRAAASSSGVDRLRDGGHRLKAPQFLVAPGVLASHTKGLHQMAHVLSLRWYQPFPQLPSLCQKFGGEQFVVVGRMRSISVFDRVYDFLSVSVCFVFHVTGKLLALVSFSELHDGLVGLPSVDVGRRSV